MSDSFTPARLADRAQIQDVMHRWCRAVDRLDIAAMPALFHPDMQDNHGAFRGGREELMAWIGQRHKTITFSLHQVSNIVIEFAGPDLALVETVFLAIQRYSPEARDSLAQSSGGKLGQPGTATDVMGTGRYVDRFERRDGVWKIARRTVVSGWKRMDAVDPDGPAPLPGWEVQRRDASDFIFRERAALGIE
ncbi:MAG: nuclear transport factor 2 family protein [Burkholderiaceae bacterium]|nr:nuclear transport factor 2 family protein [Burkholderiaceae bacterium]